MTEKRTHVYVQRPAQYQMHGCPHCGVQDPDWSEFKEHLWCPVCQRDFIPEHGGVFDVPIPVAAAQLLGMCFDRINLATMKLEKFDAKKALKKSKSDSPGREVDSSKSEAGHTPTET